MNPSGLEDLVPVRSTEQKLLVTDVTLPAHGSADPDQYVVAETWRDHVDRIGPCPTGNPAMADAIERSALAGQGGGHVPAAAKWRRALVGTGPLTVVANGAESEPVAAKDATLLRQRPHLVIDGLVLLAQAQRAERAVIWLHADDLGSRLALTQALSERPAGVAEPVVEVMTSAPHYLAGESSAISRAVSGGPALPVARRPVKAGAPRSLVHNVETLARMALVARGYEVGQTRLLTVLDAKRAVVEVDAFASFTDVLAGLGWTESPEAVLLGGYGGMWAPWERVARLPVAEPVLRAQGLTLGAGVIAPIDGVCGLRATAVLTRYLASMSARQCGPCLFGLPALVDHLDRLVRGDARVGALDDDLALVEGRGACHHPDGATRLIASALSAFSADVAEHAAGRPCSGSAGSWPGVGA